MKRTIGIMMTALLLAATGAKAENYKGTLERHGVKMEYAFSGGTVTNKSEPVYGGAPVLEMATFIDAEVKPGTTLKASCKKLKGLEKFKEVKVEIYVKGANGFHSEDVKTGDGAASYSYKVPDNVTEVSMKMSYRCWRVQLSSTVTWKVVSQPNTTTPTLPTSGHTETGTGTGREGLVKMGFSFSGGEIKKKEISNARNTERYTYECDVLVGSTITISANRISAPRGIEEVVILHMFGKSGKSPIKQQVKGAAELQYVVKPEDAGKMSTTVTLYGTGEWILEIKWNVIKKPETPMPTPTTPTGNFNWNDVAKDEHCPKCKQPYSHYELHSLSGRIGQRCKDDNGNFMEASVTEPVYFNDYLQTLSDSEASLSYGDDEDCIILKPNTTVLISKLANGNDRFTVFKGQIIGKDLKHVPAIKRPTFQLSTCTAYPRGTVFVLEDDGKQSRVWLLSGEMDVTSKKTNKKVTLKPGQAATVSADGQQKIQKFNVTAAARKFGIDTSLPDVSTSAHAGTVFSVDKLNFKVLSEKTVEVTGEVPSTYSGRVKIPAKVKYKDKTYQVVGIGKKAFADQTKMTEVIIPKTIRGIAEDAFLNTGLTEVTIPGDQVSVVKNAFRNSQKLTIVTIKGKKPACSPDAFIGCSAMKELRIRDISESNNGRMLNGTNAIIKVLK